MRPLCKCKLRPCAINYKKGNKIYYRSKCEVCLYRKSTVSPLWRQSGYKKKDKCEKCGFQSEHPEQFNVYHIDGNLTNCRYTNLKTICANCQRIMQKQGVKWKQGDLVPDH